MVSQKEMERALSTLSKRRKELRDSIVWLLSKDCRELTATIIDIAVKTFDNQLVVVCLTEGDFTAFIYGTDDRGGTYLIPDSEERQDIHPLSFAELRAKDEPQK